MATSTAKTRTTKYDVKFDNLHALTLNRAIPYREFFGAMYISPQQMRSRIGLAEEIEDVMLYVFAYWAIAASAEMYAEVDELRQDAKDKLTQIIAKHTTLDSYLEKHINNLIDEVIDTTIKHAKNGSENAPPDNGDGDNDTDYWLSPDRAMLIAENEANSFDNYVEYREAARSGKVKKKWITENDDKVRLTHEIAEGQTVDIDGLFLVGDSLMRFPMDTMYDPDPREIINCRCTCEYE